VAATIPPAQWPSPSTASRRPIPSSGSMASHKSTSSSSKSRPTRRASRRSKRSVW
jgi:hypothetical protein